LIVSLGAANLLLALLVLIVQLSLRIPYNVQKYRVRQQDSKKRNKDGELFAIFETTARAYNKITRYYEITKMVVTDELILYHTLYFIFTILGIAYHPFFFAFCLSYLIIRSPVLINVLKAVYEPRWQITLTLFLLIVVSYFFSIVSYVWFFEDFDESIQNSCYSIWSCLIVTVDQTYKNDGAVGGFLSPPFKPDSDN
jgi:hypothetical protein